jgi:hypothetical protein
MEALKQYFAAFLAFFFPEMHAGIAWHRRVRVSGHRA